MKGWALIVLLLLVTTFAVAQVELKQASIHTGGERGQGRDLSLANASGQAPAQTSSSARFVLRSGVIAAPPRADTDFIFADSFEELP